MAPKVTPPAIVARLNAEITKITNSPEVKAAGGRQCATPLVMTAEAIAKYGADYVDKWAKIVKFSGAISDN
jgi:tripartite-type tricarboxylate transporter receptor subunit TctC